MPITIAPTDERTGPHPVVLGAGLTGLAISRSLSGAGIDHVLVGTRPNDLARLGESLNAEASLEAVRQFPDLLRFFSEKRRQSIFFGDHSVTFDFLQFAGSTSWDRLLGYPSTVRLFHADRIGLDRALFDSATGSDHCQFVEGKATSLDYRPASDRVETVRLEEGRWLASTFVFDATNDVRFIAKGIGVACRVLGGPRRVVFVHRVQEEARPAAPYPWANATLLLRLESPADSVDGLAWAIPFGDRLSIGISVDPTTSAADPSALLDWVDLAFARRGIELRAGFPRREEPVDIRHEHYEHERCHGENWLLAGASCCNYWFPSAAGVATGLVAARLAPQVLMNPGRNFALYREFIAQVAASHPRLEWLTGDDPANLSSAELTRRARAMGESNLQRLAAYLRLEPTPPEIEPYASIPQLSTNGRRRSNPVTVESARPSSLATRLLASGDLVSAFTVPTVTTTPSPSPPVDLAGHPAILGLVDQLSGRRDAASVRDLFAPDLVVTIAPLTIQGFASWQSIVALLRASNRVAQLEFVPESLSGTDENPGLTGRWSGLIEGVPHLSLPFSFTISMKAGLIGSIMTSRYDYVFVLGDVATYPVGMAALLGQQLDRRSIAS